MACWFVSSSCTDIGKWERVQHKSTSYIFIIYPAILQYLALQIDSFLFCLILSKALELNGIKFLIKQ